MSLICRSISLCVVNIAALLEFFTPSRPQGLVSKDISAKRKERKKNRNKKLPRINDRSFKSETAGPSKCVLFRAWTRNPKERRGEEMKTVTQLEKKFLIQPCYLHVSRSWRSLLRHLLLLKGRNTSGECLCIFIKVPRRVHLAGNPICFTPTATSRRKLAWISTWWKISVGKRLIGRETTRSNTHVNVAVWSLSWKVTNGTWPIGSLLKHTCGIICRANITRLQIPRWTGTLVVSAKELSTVSQYSR